MGLNMFVHMGLSERKQRGKVPRVPPHDSQPFNESSKGCVTTDSHVFLGDMVFSVNLVIVVQEMQPQPAI